MKRIICFLLTLCLLSGVLGAALAEGAPEGKPWINPEWPENLPSQRPAPEENYYLYVNYDRHQQMAGDPKAAGSLYASAEAELTGKVWEMVERGECTEARALHILAGLLQDRERRNREGLEPLMVYVRRVQAVKSLEELSALCREDGFLFGNPFVRYELKQSAADPEKFAIQLSFSEPVPMLTDDNGNNTPNTKQMEEELLLLGWDAESVKKTAERVVQYQSECQSGNMDYTKKAMPTEEELLNTCTPLRDQLISQGMIPDGQTLTSVYQILVPDAFDTIRELYREENLDLFKAVIILSMYRYAVNFLDLATYAKANDITGDVDLKAVTYDYLRRDAMYLTEQAYAVTYIPQEQRNQVMAVVEECRQDLAYILQNCEWLSEESKKNAVKKALGMKAVIVNMDEHIDYEPLLKALSAEGVSLLQAVIQYDLTNLRFLLTQAGKPYDRSHRFLNIDPMLQANAVYEPFTNTLFVMAGVLLPAFYDASTQETRLACPGMLIAHEMSHGFDPSNIQINADGQRTSPLTGEDLKKYQERVMRIVNNLNRIELANGVYMKGPTKIVEMFADLTGLRITLDLAKKKEGFDYDRFFRAVTQKYFRGFQTKDAALQNYESDAHPAYYTRINYCFGQYDEFYRTHPAVREGTPMYTPAADRETIW